MSGITIKKEETTIIESARLKLTYDHNHDEVDIFEKSPIDGETESCLFSDKLSHASDLASIINALEHTLGLQAETAKEATEQVNANN